MGAGCLPHTATVTVIKVLAEEKVKFKILISTSPLLPAHVVQTYYLVTRFLLRPPDALPRAAGAFLQRVPSRSIRVERV